MPDDPKKKKQDRKTISRKEGYELRYEAKKDKVPPAKIVEAIKKSGKSRTKVRKSLGK